MPYSFKNPTLNVFHIKAVLTTLHNMHMYTNFFTLLISLLQQFHCSDLVNFLLGINYVSSGFPNMNYPPYTHMQAHTLPPPCVRIM